MVLTVEEHPLVTMFPQFFRQLPGHADAVIGIPLNLLIVALANVCARPIAGLPAIDLTLGRDMLLPDAMEFRLTNTKANYKSVPPNPLFLKVFRSISGISNGKP